MALAKLGFEKYPVAPRTFIEDPQYLGGSTSHLHEKLKQELDFVLSAKNNIVEWILKGAIGYGKTSVAVAAELYKVYLLTCLKDPATFYGLLPGSTIVFYIFSITLGKADSGYSKLKTFMNESPYFQKVCPHLQRPKDPIFIPSKRIRIDVGSKREHALSEDTFGFILDEANFFKLNTDKETSQKDSTRAHELYKQAKRRQTSRFMTPGLNCLLSSQLTQTHFLEERVKAAKDDPTVHVTSFALWDTKPSDQYCGVKFSVMVGDGQRSSRILDEDEVSPEGLEVVEVPVEYKEIFEDVPDGVLIIIHKLCGFHIGT